MVCERIGMGAIMKAKILAGLALTLHLAVGYPYLVSGIVAPAYAVPILYLLWAVLLVLLLDISRTRPLLALLIPPAALALLLAILALGDILLGWTA